MTIPIFDLSVRCGFFCQGGSPQFDQTEYPDNYSVVKYPDHLAAMQRADEDYKNVEAVANLAISLANEFEIAVASREPRSGMSVPPSGDFISCAQLPSAVGRMKWWAREIRKAQERWRA